MTENEIQQKAHARPDLVMTDSLLKAFMEFTERGSAKRLSRSLRNLIVVFLTFDDAVTAIDVEDLFHELEPLFQFLDKIEDEQSRGIA